MRLLIEVFVGSLCHYVEREILMYWYRRKVLVIGGASFIGSLLVDHLMTLGTEVGQDSRYLPAKRVSMGMGRL